ncbi:DsrE family protein [Emticicia fontis]
MKNYFLSLIILFLSVNAVSAQTNTKSMKFLIHVTQGPKDSTRAALAFLVAKTALEEGHTVNLFLAGDAVKLIQDSNLNSVIGLGTGKLREHFDAIVKGNGHFYLSGNSSKARGVGEVDIKGKPAEFALPKVLVSLIAESDHVITY